MNPLCASKYCFIKGHIDIRMEVFSLHPEAAGPISAEAAASCAAAVETTVLKTAAPESAGASSGTASIKSVSEYAAQEVVHIFSAFKMEFLIAAARPVRLTVSSSALSAEAAVSAAGLRAAFLKCSMAELVIQFSLFIIT